MVNVLTNNYGRHRGSPGSFQPTLSTCFLSHYKFSCILVPASFSIISVSYYKLLNTPQPSTVQSSPTQPSPAPDSKQGFKWFLASVWVSFTVEITPHSLHCLSLTFRLLSLSSKENNRLYTEAKLNLRSVSQPPSSRHYFKETWSILSIKKTTMVTTWKSKIEK